MTASLACIILYFCRHTAHFLAVAGIGPVLAQYFMQTASPGFPCIIDVTEGQLCRHAAQSFAATTDTPLVAQQLRHLSRKLSLCQNVLLLRDTTAVRMQSCN